MARAAAIAPSEEGDFEGLVNYLRPIARKHPRAYLGLLGRLIKKKRRKTATRSAYESVDDMRSDIIRRGKMDVLLQILLLLLDDEHPVKDRREQDDIKNCTPTIAVCSDPK